MYYYLKSKFKITSIIFISILLTFGGLLDCYSADIAYQDGVLSGGLTNVTIGNALNQIGAAVNKTISIEGGTIPQQEINAQIDGFNLDDAIKTALALSGVYSYNVVYNGESSESSSYIRIIIADKLKPIDETTGQAYLDKKYGSRVNYLWESDAITLFEEAAKPVPANIKAWVIRVLMSDIESESENIRSPRITKEIVADILKRHTPKKDQKYLSSQIDSLLP